MAAKSSAGFPNLTVLSHPLIQHKLSILRDKRTSTRDFKQLVNEIAMLMAYEVTKDLPLEPVEIETPLEKMTGSQVAGKKLTLVPILRAGLGMVEGISQLIPSARVGHIGLYRNHDTLQPVDYYFKIPSGKRIARSSCWTLCSRPAGPGLLRSAPWRGRVPRWSEFGSCAWFAPPKA